MHVCVCVCVCVCVYIGETLGTIVQHVSADLWRNGVMMVVLNGPRAHTYTAYTYIYTYVCTDIYMYIYVCIHLYRYIYMYIYVYIHLLRSGVMMVVLNGPRALTRQSVCRRP